MKEERKKLILIKTGYWLGIGADAIWAVGLFFPSVFGLISGNMDFSPDFQTRQIMSLGGVLMSAWTILLLWAVRSPIERRFVIFLTAFPCVAGLSLIALNGYLAGNTVLIWVLVKTLILFATMITSYILSEQYSRKLNNQL